MNEAAGRRNENEGMNPYFLIIITHITFYICSFIPSVSSNFFIPSPPGRQAGRQATYNET